MICVTTACTFLAKYLHNVYFCFANLLLTQLHHLKDIPHLFLLNSSAREDCKNLTANWTPNKGNYILKLLKRVTRTKIL